ncbi:MAG: hypothetical protein ACI909_000105, partial [Planctomycetota bacterium]
MLLQTILNYLHEAGRNLAGVPVHVQTNTPLLVSSTGVSTIFTEVPEGKPAPTTVITPVLVPTVPLATFLPAVLILKLEQQE